MFTSSNGSTWLTMKASRLATIPTWKGQRIIDDTHMTRISQSITSIQDLDINPYRIVIIDEEGEECRYIVDGQHRVSLLRKFFQNPNASDFDVVVIVKSCETEADIIEYFEIVNRMKPMHYREDPVLAANKFIVPFMKEFNTDPKKPVVRAGKVNRPYLSSDRLREVLIEKHVVEWRLTPVEFVARCREINDDNLENLDLSVLTNRRAHDLKFSLGLLDFKFL